MPLEVACTNEEKVAITASPQTITGRAAQIDGVLRVTVQSGEGTFEEPTTEAPNTFKVVSGDNPGDTVYLVEADADLGEGVETISDTVTLTVSGARAQNFGLTAGTPEPK